MGTVVVTFPETRPCVFRGKWDQSARTVPHPHGGVIASDMGYGDVCVAHEVVRHTFHQRSNGVRQPQWAWAHSRLNVLRHSTSGSWRAVRGGRDMHVGFIGVGAMGRPMATNLIKKGFTVTAYDASAEALAAIVKLGAAKAGSSADAARMSDIVITILPSSANVVAAYLGEGGVLEGAAAGRLCVDMSTIDPATSRLVAATASQRGLRFIDAPVSGGVPRAEDGTLAIMVGGERTDVEEAHPVLAAMGATIIHVGPVGSGEVAKLCNNLIAGVAAVAVSEAFRIAEGFGVDPKVVTEVISKSSGNTWLMENMHPVAGLVPRAASTNGYAPGFMTDLMCKDIGLAVDAARNLRVPLFVAPAAQQVYRLASSHGLGRKDFTSVYTFLSPSAGTAPV